MKIAITTDCVCDLPQGYLAELGVEMIYFYITTDHGCFRDIDEMTSVNVVEYFNNGGQHIGTASPGVNEYEGFFRRVLNKHDEVIHLALGAAFDVSYHNATEAAESFGGRVRVVDTEQLSTGIGHLVIAAAQLASGGMASDEIIKYITGMKDRVCTTFISERADYLYRNGRVSRFVMWLCDTFRLHPVLCVKGGELKLHGIKIGDYDRCVMRYVRSVLKRSSAIDPRELFITHSDCSTRTVNIVKHTASGCCHFDKVVVTKASATITANCGSNTIGVLYVKK